MPRAHQPDPQQPGGAARHREQGPTIEISTIDRSRWCGRCLGSAGDHGKHQYQLRRFRRHLADGRFHRRQSDSSRRPLFQRHRDQLASPVGTGIAHRSGTVARDRRNASHELGPIVLRRLGPRKCKRPTGTNEGIIALGGLYNINYYNVTQNIVDTTPATNVSYTVLGSNDNGGLSRRRANSQTALKARSFPTATRTSFFRSTSSTRPASPPPTPMAPTSWSSISTTAIRCRPPA